MSTRYETDGLVAEKFEQLEMAGVLAGLEVNLGKVGEGPVNARKSVSLGWVVTVRCFLP